MIEYIDRKSGKIEREKVYGEAALRFLYGGSRLGALLAALLSRFAFFSAAYGLWQKMAWTKKKIAPFIQAFKVDPSEFSKPVDAFTSFNDFFIRTLKKEARPLASTDLIIPADGRYLAYSSIDDQTLTIKGQTFDLPALFGSKALSDKFREGSLLMARLCPSDYHRFHFPCDCLPQQPQWINGYLYSVNPIAINKRLSIFWENKRVLTLLDTAQHGQIAYFEVGATNVGSIHHTYPALTKAKKGDEKGYFSFGGSSLLLFFEKNRVQLPQDLLTATQNGYETLCLMGQPL